MELNEQLTGGHVEVRLAGRDVSLAYIEGEAAAPEPAAEDEHSARITLRLPEGLKSRAESSASADGVSLNTWLVRATQRALDGNKRGPGRRMTGYASS
jgi:predicted HicB family RNase H-like nuclease